ncbi:ArgR family transcriptional regulator, partial [Enterococcus faecium]|nr:ArgR family transcriptional regulator [Enterococcus faecium]
MKKKQRQALIRQIITEQPIGTQEELLARLHEAGADVTQATISRDIREMKLVKSQ